MSVIFGVCVPENSIVDKESLFSLANETKRYGKDGTEIYIQGRIGMGFQAFHTNYRSRLEQQPAVDLLGNILVLDGRLDNHQDLAARLDIGNGDVSDSVLILKAFARWGDDSFAYLVGDWALALWSSNDRVLYLARDHAGTRTLYYRNQEDEIRWSTYLETFIADSSPELSQEYMARILSSQDIGDLTPYKGIQSVTPAHFIAIRKGQVVRKPHWRWVADTTIAYKTEAEYDEHFLFLFQQAVQRRIGPGDPVLAQLSGGMDSTSIVCMADKIVMDSNAGSDLIDTISYYDNSEPNWDERPYFMAVEKHRNKVGIHLDCTAQKPKYEPLVQPDRVYPYPGGDRIALDIANQLEQSIPAGRYRAILSGIGGDELLGGVPALMPELANYLRGCRLATLLSRATEWCMVDRQSLLRVLSSTVKFTCDLYRPLHILRDSIPPWLNDPLRQICLRAGSRDEPIYSLIKARPSAINNGRIWWQLLETLPHLAPSIVGCYEYRYPYLDRDLVEFLHRVPREQLVQPGRRRFLMRRALKDIVPMEILERRRKAYISNHGLISDLRNAQEAIEGLFANPLSADYDLIDSNRFLLAFRAGLAGDLKWIGPLVKTIRIELWLRSLVASGSTLINSYVGNGIRKLRPDVHRTTKLRVEGVER